MKLAHLSDIHVCDKNSASVFTRVLEDALNRGVGHFIISGDLINSGSDEEYELVTAVLKKFDLLKEDKLSVIPGNHDLFRTVFSRVISTGDLIKQKRLIPSLLFDIARYTRKDYEHDLQKFNSYFSPVFEGAVTVPDNHQNYPYAKVLSEKTAIICIDSNMPLSIRQNLFASNGYVNIKRIENLLKHPELSGKSIIPVLHHCLYEPGILKQRHDLLFESSQKLHNRDAVVNCFTGKGISLVLHGHYHENEIYQTAGNCLKVLNAGCGYAGRWFLIDINSDEPVVTAVKSLKT